MRKNWRFGAEHSTRGTQSIKPMRKMRPLHPAEKPRKKKETANRDVVMLDPKAVEMRGVVSFRVSPDVATGLYLDSYEEQLRESRESSQGPSGKGNGFDQRGLDAKERAAWASILRGFSILAMLLFSFQAYADSAPLPPNWDGPKMIFPTKDTNLNPLPKSGDFALKGCKVYVNGDPNGFWVNPIGKTQVTLTAPTLISALPWKWEAACCNQDCYSAGTWGPSGTATLAAPIFTSTP